MNCQKYRCVSAHDRRVHRLRTYGNFGEPVIECTVNEGSEWRAYPSKNEKTFRMEAGNENLMVWFVIGKKELEKHFEPIG